MAHTTVPRTAQTAHQHEQRRRRHRKRLKKRRSKNETKGFGTPTETFPTWPPPSWPANTADAQIAGSRTLRGARERPAGWASWAVERLEAFGEPGSHVGFVDSAGGDGEHEVDGVVGGDLKPVSVEDAEHGE